MSDVTHRHQSFVDYFEQWLRLEDAAAGEDAVKAKREQYLPRPNAHDDSKENKERYNHYLKRAVYYNVTGRTLKSMLGLVFSKDPTLTLPTGLEALEMDASGSGITLFQQAQATLAEVLKTGRAALLADYPRVAPPASAAESANRQPYVITYKATDVINWRVEKIDGRFVLTLIVIREFKEVPDGTGFGVLRQECHRVLKLAPASNADGAALVYWVEIWEMIEDVQTKKTTWTVTDTYTPLQGNGQPWSEMPFTFVGAENNDWNVDKAPLGDIATLNLAHYRNSADYEDSCYFVGQPQFYMGGLTKEWYEMLKADGIYVGSRSMLPLPTGATAGILQVQPNTMAKEAMADKEQQMAAIGARLIQIIRTSKTATQQDSEDAVSNSVLSLCAENVSSAYRKALGWCANFANIDGAEVDLTLSSDYSRTPIDAQTLIALLQAVQAGRMPETDFFQQLRYAGYVDALKTDDMIREEISSQSPSGAVNLDQGAGADGGNTPPSGDGAAPKAAPSSDGNVQDTQSEPEPPAMDPQAVAQILDALNRIAARPDPPAPVINLPPQPPPVITVESPVVNVPPPQITVEPATVNFQPGSISVEVAAPPPAQVTVEPATVNVSPPAVTVEAPTVNVQAPIVNVMAPKPLRTIPVRNGDGTIKELIQQEIP